MPSRHPHYQLFRNAFTATVKLSALHPLPADFAPMGRTHALFKCPCGSAEHAATCAMDFNTGRSITMSSVLHCWETQQQWMIVKDVAGVMAGEEAKFATLLERFIDSGFVGKRVSASEAFTLHTERGCPHELLEIDDVERFNEMMDQHRAVSRGKGRILERVRP